MHKQIKIYILLVCQICGINLTFGQIKANFTISKKSGCEPLGNIYFVNTTTGATASTTYSWDFGNGNTSPSSADTVYASYANAKTYIIKLTAKDGNTSSTYIDTVTVYASPTVDFGLSATTACVPLTVDFTPKVNGNGAGIVSYLWDFGDGNTSTQSNPSHTYTYGIKPKVILSVTNSNGCQSAISKSEISVLPYPVVSFKATDTFFCSVNSTANFADSTVYDTTQFGSLSYVWDFGDGTTSTQANPSHIYTSKGNFTVKLTATNSLGCQSSATKNGYITVASFSTKINSDNNTCMYNDIQISDGSALAATNRIWTVDGVDQTTNSSSFDYTFVSSGNHVIKLRNFYNNCPDTASKTIFVNPPVTVNNFEVTKSSGCTLPSTIHLIDTQHYTNGEIQWMVVSPSGTESYSNSKTYDYSATDTGTYIAELTITDTVLGCSNSSQQSFAVSTPVITIQHPDTISVCMPFALQFSAKSSIPTDTVKATDYYWDFGDWASGANNNSTLILPIHVYNDTGTFYPTLYYSTVSGCSGSVADIPIIVHGKPESKFSVSKKEICGSGTLNFSDSSTDSPIQWYWNFGDSSLTQKDFYSTQQNPSHQYLDSGFYTVSLIVKNSNCADTTVQVNYVHILPDFPAAKISQDCTNRNDVSLLNSSREVDSLVWNTNDGSTPVTITPTGKVTVTHTYSQTGTYLDTLTAYKNITYSIDTTTKCIVSVPLTVNVLKKQNPVLALLNTTCSSVGIDFKISGLEHNPSSAPGNSYSLYQLQFDDGTTFSGKYQSTNSDTVITGTLFNGFGGKDSIRIILQSQNFGCYDTTNYIAVNGVLTANFSTDTTAICYKQNPISFTDKSVARKNIPIIKWVWDFGDGITDTITDKSKVNIPHPYSIGYYYPTLTVIDSSGCTSTTAVNSTTLLIDGPKASFSFSPTDSIIPYTNVTFVNNSSPGADGYSVNYTWHSKQWSSSTATDTLSHVYGNTQPDTVTLIASSPLTLCQNDTATKIIPVQMITVAFSDSMYYLKNSNCPPLAVSLKNKSVNTQNILWSFGDGSYSYLDQPQHIYNEAGDFKIVLYGYGKKGYIDSAYDSIHVPGAIGSLKSVNINSSACSPATFQFIASTNAVSYSWDYGDASASVTSTSDTSYHTYTIGGIFHPGLVMTDKAGCVYEKLLTDSLMVDTLHVNINHSPLVICDSGYITFTPVATSVFNYQPSYNWQFANGRTMDSSKQISPQFYGNTIGTAYAKLHATSSTGCVFDAVDSVIIHPYYSGNIIGDSDVCYNTSVQYNATSPTGSNTSWVWNFNNENTDSSQVPALQKFTDTTSGYTHNINLNVTMDGCSSTVNKLIWVHTLPANILSVDSTHNCLNDSLSLSANGGVHYLWTPAQYISNDTVSNPKVSPPVNTTYSVTATDRYGCSNSDSVYIQVIQPITVALTADTFICHGGSVQLNAQGAITYLWDTSSYINNINISNPVVTPPNSMTFKVKGYSLYNCFADTAQVYVDVKASPSVSFNSDTLQVMTNDQTTIQPIYSSDVVSYSWTPSTNLSCTDCANPVATALSDITYKIEVQNQYQCTASDSVTVFIYCSAGRIYIPSAFTPNNDGRNDRLYVMGKGMKQVNYFKIFDRYGKPIFARYNCSLNDATAGWDGTYNGGMKANIGTYIYEVQVQCDSGTVYNYRGTVVLIR